MSSTNWQAHKKSLLTLFVPKSDIVYRVGLHLLLLNLLYILVSIGLFILTYFAVLFIPFIPMFSMFLVFFIVCCAIGYFIMWGHFIHQYSRLRSWKVKTYIHVIKVFGVSVLGILPNVLGAFYFGNMLIEDPESCGFADVLAYFIFLLSSIVMPCFSVFLAWLRAFKSRDR